MRLPGNKVVLACVGGCLVLLTAAAPNAPDAPREPVTERAADGDSQPSRRVRATMPGPRRTRADDDHAERRAALNQGCEGCHPAIAAEWRASLHRQSHTDPVYLRAFAREPLPFCQGCHAPETDPRVEVPQAAAELGVGCVTCHVTDEHTVLAAPRDGAAATAHGTTAPALLESPAFATGSDACARCHEFAFPDMKRRARPALMQTTIREHRRSEARDRACADCHMPRVEGADGTTHRAHTFAASRDPEMLRSAVEVTARCRPGGVTLELRPGRIGHAFPTGDLFRRLELELTDAATDERLARRYLARRFAAGRQRDGHFARVPAGDDRVGVSRGPTVVELDAPGRGPLRWRLTYQRVEHPRGVDPTAAEIAGEHELAAGLCPPSPPSPTRSHAR